MAELGPSWPSRDGRWWWGCPAPLDTGFRQYDDGGCSGRQALWVAEAEVPACAGTTRRRGRVRLEAEAPPRLAPALGSRFRGKDDGGVRVGRRCWLRGGEVPLMRDGRFAKRRGFGGVGVAMGVGGGVAPPLWIPASASMNGGCSGRQRRLRFPCGRDTTRDGGAPAPRPCPGFPLSREGRWGRGLLRVPSGQASTGSGRTDEVGRPPNLTGWCVRIESGTCVRAWPWVVVAARWRPLHAWGFADAYNQRGYFCARRGGG